MKSYSPYDNVAATGPAGQPVRYPDILATAGLSDPRVGFWEPAKWVAKLRAANPENRVLLKTEMGAGHGGPSGRYDAWKDEAFVYAFVLDALGLSDTRAGAVPGRRRRTGRSERWTRAGREPVGRRMAGRAGGRRGRRGRCVGGGAEASPRPTG